MNSFFELSEYLYTLRLNQGLQQSKTVAVAIDLVSVRIRDIKDDGRMPKRSHICLEEHETPVAVQILEKSLYDIARIEDDPIRNYEYVEREAVKNVILIPRMALYLSEEAVEAICDKIFTRHNINEQFVTLFYKYFFHVYVKRDCSWSSLQILFKASQAYPQHFKTAIREMMVDSQFPSNILRDYIRCLKQEDCKTLLKTVSELQLTPEQFNRNEPVIRDLLTKVFF